MPELPSPTHDGLYIPTVGEWSKDKYYFLSKYINAFTTSMRQKWQELHYIDLFAGAGIVKLRKSKILCWGSPLIAAQTRHKFTRLHLCEKDLQNFQALSARVERFTPNAQLLNGDANDKVHYVVKDIPQRGVLSLAFFDPYGLHLDFETLLVLKQNRIDLIIYFPDRLDALRNWKKYYLDNPDSNLDRFLGPGVDWRSLQDGVPQQRRAEHFRDLYVGQIKTLGYSEFEYRRISSKGHPLYILIFCSRSKLAGKLWRGISQKELNGQRTFDFEKS